MPAEDFVGIPYRFNGRDRSGVDCLGLVILYLRHLGFNPPDGDGRPIEDDWRLDAESRITTWLGQNAVPVSTPVAGDIVVFRLPGGTMHFGVMADTTNVLHITEDRPSMLTPLRLIRRRLLGLYRLRRG